MPWKTFQEEIYVNAKYYLNNCTDFITEEHSYSYCDDITGDGKEKCCQETVSFFYTDREPNVCYNLKNNSSLILNCEFSSINRDFGIRVCVILSIVMVLVLITYTNSKNKNPYFRNPEDVKTKPEEKEKLIVNSTDRDKYDTV